jgi:hypothetical protein
MKWPQRDDAGVDCRWTMSLNDELSAFYRRSGFGPTIGARRITVPVYTGCMLVPLPNIEARRRYLKYHDIHHLVTGYSVGRIGEGEVSAWELGAGSMFVSTTLGLMNLIALSTGLFLEPRRMWRAFVRGCTSRTLYSANQRRSVDAAHWASVDAIRKEILETQASRMPISVRAVEFAGYAAAAVAIHALIAIPAVIARLITDLTLGYTVFQAIKPKRRADLY